MEKTNYIFIGAGGHARVLASVIESNQDKLIAVFDDNLTIHELDGVKNEGEYQKTKYSEAQLIIAIGDNKIRERISKNIHHSIGKAIHASAVVDRIVDLAEGVQLFRGIVIAALPLESIQLSIPTPQLIMTVRSMILFILPLEQLSVGESK